jgi:anti-sigma regulatory factor (Ser/Thr protein kinase)/putative methionine-R-sulfoxide reductase with GAF domain
VNEADPAARLDELEQLTDASLAYLPLDDLLRELLERIAALLDSDTAAVLMLEEDGQMLRARAAKGIEEEVEQGVRIPLGGGFAGRIAAEKRAIAIPDVDHGDVLNPILRQKGIRSLLGVPLPVAGRVIGVLHVGTLRPRDFTENDARLLQLAADRAAPVIENARMYEERRLVEALQRTLLPGPLPQIVGMTLSARYEPASVAGRIGGDWYDVFRLAQGRIGLVVGDVVGRGVPAAAMMAQLRTALRAYAREGHSPAVATGHLNALLRELSGPEMTTLCYLVLDPAEERLTVTSAGHLPPLLIAPDGEPSYLPVENGVALGVSALAGYEEQEFPLAPGSSIVLFTDGAVEVRGESLDVGLERVRALAASGLRGGPLCDAILGLVPDATDDVAVIAADIEPLGERMVTRWPADVTLLADMRHLLRRWLRQHGADPSEVFEITVACQEACANAIEHAYAPGPAAYELHAIHREGEVEIKIRDHGRWRAPRGRHRGRGTRIMEALVDALDVVPDSGGTTVTLRRALSAGRRA